MPRPKSAQPAYQYHVSGQAKVRLADVDFYLGKHGTPESYARYYALLAEYNANGKVAPSREGKQQQLTHQADTPILVRHVTADFRERVLPRHEHSPSHYACFVFLLDLLDKKHGDHPVAEFGPRKLEALRDGLVARGNCRKYANEQIGKVIKIIEHGVSRELVQPDRIVALRALEPLKAGQAKENPPRSAVALEVVRASLPHLTPTARAMLTIQLATAMRPSELFRMRPCDIDRSGPTWFYRPPNHKTAHHGKAKAIPIVGEAFKALAPFMFGDANELCFLTSKGTPWNKDSYRIAVARAAKAAKVEHWTPYQIRHTTLQAVRDAAGPECTQALAGHSRLQMTEVYAKASELKAVEAARHVPTL
jgi:integrase